MGWRGPVIVTGTDTGVGKTVVTAGICAAASAAGLGVAVVKPAQSGDTSESLSDVEEVRRLAAPVTVRALASYPAPLAPLVAARVAGAVPLDLDTVAYQVRTEALRHDLVLVEGAGGLLVPIGLLPDGAAWTVADLAVVLGAPVVVVARAGLGTLNHTALTLEALRHRGVPACVVIGAWPAAPEYVHLSNVVELAGEMAGVVPDGAAAIEPGVFRRSASGWFAPLLHGDVDDVREWLPDEA